MDCVFTTLGSFAKYPLESEEKSRKNARRSLVALRSIPIGKVIDRDDLTWKRPASGISPRDIHSVLGKKAIIEIAEDTVMKWTMIEG
jgi:N-acetylneuraminate synthase